MNAIEKNLRFRIGTAIGNSNILFSLNYFRTEYKNKIIRSDSDCCIEGFQRSGNSFFIKLFVRKNRSIKVAHHTHAASQIIRALKFEVPTIVLIRDPEQVIASLLAWDTNLRVHTAMNAYISYHEKLLPYVKQFLLVAFEDVIAKPVDVVKVCNERFGTTFALPKFTDQQLDKIKKGILSRNVAISSPLPTPEKEKIKEEVRQLIKENPKLSEAKKVYQQLYIHIHQF